MRSSGKYQASGVIICPDYDQVQRMLPAGLTVMPQNVTPPGKHPLIFMFGRQSNVRLRGLSLWGMNYLEAAILIPYVQRTASSYPYRGPFLFLPRLFVDEALPAVLSRFYGVGAQTAHIIRSERSYLVAHPLFQTPLISERIIQKRPIAPFLKVPLFDMAIATLFRQPVLGKTWLSLFVSAILDTNFHQAQLQPVEAEIQIHQSFLPGLPRGTFCSAGYDQEPLGAFCLDTEWSLTLPFPLLI